MLLFYKEVPVEWGGVGVPVLKHGSAQNAAIECLLFWHNLGHERGEGSGKHERVVNEELHPKDQICAVGHKVVSGGKDAKTLELADSLREGLLVTAEDCLRHVHPDVLAIQHELDKAVRMVPPQDIQNHLREGSRWCPGTQQVERAQLEGAGPTHHRADTQVLRRLPHSRLRLFWPLSQIATYRSCWGLPQHGHRPYPHEAVRGLFHQKESAEE